MKQRYTCSVFVVPRVVRGLPYADFARKLIERTGFDVVDTSSLTDAQVAELRKQRFGDDPIDPGRGPFDALIAVDVCPYHSDENGSARLDNGRLLRTPQIEQDVRREVCARVDDGIGVAEENRMFIWKTWNSREAWSLIRRWMPGREDYLREDFCRRLEAIRSPFPIIHTFRGHKSNALVHRVRYSTGEQAVCRIYRKGREHFYENHLKIAALSDVYSEIPPLIDKGDNWIVMPMYADYERLTEFYARKKLQSMIPLQVSRRLFSAVEGIHDAGYALLDFHSANVLISRRNDVKILDFDHVHAFDEIPSFYESPTITGYNRPLKYNGPFGEPPSYESAWQHMVGLDIRTLMESTTSYQCFRRAVEGVRRLPWRTRCLVERQLGANN